jgi:hypothetical protein
VAVHFNLNEVKRGLESLFEFIYLKIRLMTQKKPIQGIFTTLLFSQLFLSQSSEFCLIYLNHFFYVTCSFIVKMTKVQSLGDADRVESGDRKRNK